MKQMISFFGFFAVLAGCAAILAAWPRPQDPRNRPYRIESVQFAGGPGVTLAGELTMPRTGGPFRAIILITGSGPQDRNETIVGHRPFLVLSDHLTRAGYAVLRYDDRGVGQSTGDFKTATMSDFANDAAGAFSWLSAHPEIDSSAIGFIGHSEGGYIAPAAARMVPAAFMVLLAGPAKRLLPDVMARQFADIQRVDGVGKDIMAKARRQYEGATRILGMPGTIEDTRVRLDTYLEAEGLSARQRAETLDLWGNPWGIEYATHDPVPALRAFDGPVLALFGSTDLQVSAEENAPVMRRNLVDVRSEVVVFEGLNHLFQPSESGSIDDYIWIDTTIDPMVMTKITEWLESL